MTEKYFIKYFLNLPVNLFAKAQGMFRSVVVNSLKTKYSEKRAKVYEEAIYKNLKKQAKNMKEDDFEKYYVEQCYEILSKLFKAPTEEHTDILKASLNIFSNPVFDAFDNKRKIENNRFVNPPQVEEGGFKCKKCKQSRTQFYSLQVSACDEPMTNFITCMNPECGNKWKEK